MSFFGFSQNTSTNTFTAKGITEILVEGNQIFNITVIATPTENIIVKSITDGEYQNNFQVRSEVKGNRLVLELKRAVIEKTPDDKRNAHKVIAATVELTIPENLNVSITSDIGSVNANGIFNELKLNLAQGGCNINGMARLATIKTTDGNIKVQTKDAIIETDSKSGLVNFPSDMFGFNVWRLTTVGGNITVTKRE